MSHKEQAEQAAIYARRVMQLERGYDELRTVNNRLQARLAIAEDAWHMANGTADLAMKHRDMAEARLAQAERLLREEADAMETAAAGSDEFVRRWGILGFLDGTADSAPDCQHDVTKPGSTWAASHPHRCTVCGESWELNADSAAEVQK